MVRYAVTTLPVWAFVTSTATTGKLPVPRALGHPDTLDTHDLQEARALLEELVGSGRWSGQ